MLTFEQKMAIIESFHELEKKNVSLGRINYHYEDSVSDKKNVIYHLHPNGNGFVYAEKIDEYGYRTDGKGMINIREFSEQELRNMISKSIASLKENAKEEAAIIDGNVEERWMNEDGHTLILLEEDDMWNVYAGLNLDGTFPSYNEAKQYLMEEGFSLLRK
ncbi:hypothetical protein [Heyndrickxia acidicola]|uniref:Phage protein n=1 Tax=Heyndrickxia acidicola TaxID=209389 RepID=A0ABU6MF42_9BACI|nr:hypothetical protein [Heyndrickxia acidicola]MED1201660.1 hypothetical protein [Heyndrickxia acidicola]